MKQSITLMGMSGVGKTTLSLKLPKSTWFHYSGDYRIATHYLADQLGDFLKIEAMKSPLIAELLKTDSIYIGSNVSFDNLSSISAYISKLGSSHLGGLDLDTFMHRQRQYSKAEKAACYDVGYYKARAKNLYGYDYFLFDAGGSLCELEDDAVIKHIAKETTIVYLYADESLIETITQRALDYPKPIYYNEKFLKKQLDDYKKCHTIDASDGIDNINPNEFIRHVFPKLIQHRHARYLTIAEQYGKIINANDVFSVRDQSDFLELIQSS